MVFNYSGFKYRFSGRGRCSPGCKPHTIVANLSKIIATHGDAQCAEMCFATIAEANRNIWAGAAVLSSFFRFSDFEIHFQKLPVGKFINAEFGGNFHHDVFQFVWPQPGNLRRKTD